MLKALPVSVPVTVCDICADINPSTFVNIISSSDMCSFVTWAIMQGIVWKCTEWFETQYNLFTVNVIISFSTISRIL